MAGESRELTLPNTLKIGPAVKIRSGMASGTALLLEATRAAGFDVPVFFGVAGTPGFGSTGGNVESGFEGVSEVVALRRLVACSPVSFFLEATDVDGAAGLRGASAEEGFTATSGAAEAVFDSPVSNAVGISILLSISMTDPRINAQGIGKFVVHGQKAVV